MKEFNFFVLIIFLSLLSKCILLSCPWGCSSCESESSCNACYYGYYLSESSCHSCDSSCYRCTSSSYCTSCNSGYYFSDYSCPPCDSNCKTCYGSSTSCISCVDGYYLSKSKCYQCSSNCKTCSSYSYSCNSCNTGYYLSNYRCELCPTGCYSCTSSTNCDSCKYRYFLDSHECLQCNYNCKTTIQYDSCKCSSCNNGYYLYRYQCLKCNTNCETCSDSADKCLSCNNGYYLSNNTCHKCPSTCLNCTNSSNCLACLENHFLLSGMCYQCNYNCNTTESDNCKCLSCNDGYYLLNSQCHQCNSNCKTCINTDIYCLSCDDGYYLTSINTCAKCIHPCKTCLSETKCLSCISDYFLLSNECIKCNINCKTSRDNCKCTTCDIGFYFYKYQCLNCSTTCRTCKSKADYCTNCHTNKYLDDHSCLDCDGSCNNEETDVNEKDEEAKYYDEVLQNIENIFTSEYYDTSYLDSGNEEVIEIDKIKIVLTTTSNQKNNDNEDSTSIDFGECENILRDYYNISIVDKIYVKKVDIKQDNMQIPKLEYEVYGKFNGSNLVKLNLSVCGDSKISLIIPVEISESIDKFNTSSGYFNNICYSSSSEKGTYIPLKDRQNEFVEQNKTICQDDCDLINYNYTTKKVNCSCEIKESSISFSDMHINKTKLYKNFIEIKNIANINILVCYKNLFRKEGLINNIGSYIIIIIFIFHIICIIIFYNKQYHDLKARIKAIVFAVKNIELLDKSEIKNNKKKEKKKNKTIEFKAKRNISNNKNKDNNDVIQLKENNKKKNKNKTIEINNNSHNNNLDHNDNSEIMLDQVKHFNRSRNSDKNNKSNSLNKKSSNNKSNKKRNISNKKMSKSNGSKSGSKTSTIKTSKNNTKTTGTNNNSVSTNNKNLNIKKKLKEKIKRILAYIEEEINSLSYDLAIKNDKRNYFKYYISLIKTQHDFFFSFILKKDYNARIIKMDFYFICFLINYTVNGLFFDDNTMHKIYESDGSFEIESEIAKILYSSLISLVINKILRILALSNEAVIKFKEDKNKKNIDKRKKELIKNLNIRFALYFILSSLLLLCFWYYLAMFGAIYRNTQINLIEDTLISFGLSNLYPFFIFLLPGLFRIPALSNPKNKREVMYNFSKLLQAL